MNDVSQNTQAAACSNGAKAVPAAVGMPEGFIGKKELSRLVNRATRTIGDWMRSGKIPYYKVGHAVLFKWSEVEEGLRESCRVWKGKS